MILPQRQRRKVRIVLVVALLRVEQLLPVRAMLQPTMVYSLIDLIGTLDALLGLRLC